MRRKREDKSVLIIIIIIIIICVLFVLCDGVLFLLPYFLSFFFSPCLLAATSTNFLSHFICSCECFPLFLLFTSFSLSSLSLLLSL
jgi:uncharacterized protein YqhQ